MKESVPRILTIAGSDSGGGAGIEADLKTFTALRVYGMAAITCVTAQNTVGVTAVQELDPALVAEQIDAVARDIGIDAAKTGMLSNEGIIEAVAERVAANGIGLLVVDPVMVAKSGDLLLRESARGALIRGILPISFLVTPNIRETEVLTGMRVIDRRDIEEAARRIHGLGARHVLIKGGHMEGDEATDYLFDGTALWEFSVPRIPTQNTHGTGCTYSAAIAAYLGRGLAVSEAVRQAKAYLTEAIRQSFELGQGHGPLNHFWNVPASFPKPA